MEQDIICPNTQIHVRTQLESTVHDYIEVFLHYYHLFPVRQPVWYTNYSFILHKNISPVFAPLRLRES